MSCSELDELNLLIAHSNLQVSCLETPIQLIVGLGNPGTQYADTRHNAGYWFVAALAEQLQITLRSTAKFFGLTGLFDNGQIPCRFLLPTTFMNNSGRAVQALANFYRIPASAILIVHDELDLPAGILRFKQGGGDGGHNGLKDITAQLNTKIYWRLRVGIGHPGTSAQVLNYVLGAPPKIEKEKIMSAITLGLEHAAFIFKGELPIAMQEIHTKLHH